MESVTVRGVDDGRAGPPAKADEAAAAAAAAVPSPAGTAAAPLPPSDDASSSEVAELPELPRVAWVAILTCAASGRCVVGSGGAFHVSQGCMLLTPPFPSLPTLSDAAALACLCRGARDAARGSRWRDAVRVSPACGRVREPESGRFAVEVSPGTSLQAAVRRCPIGGAILLRPGTHAGPMTIAKEVHVFGRGEATLMATPSGTCILVSAPVATLDGLIVRGPLVAPVPRGDVAPAAVFITAGSARLQGCDISTLVPGVGILGGDPLLLNCR